MLSETRYGKGCDPNLARATELPGDIDVPMAAQLCAEREERDAIVP